MSTVTDPEAPPAKSTDVSRTLSKGAWYLIELLLQKTDPAGSNSDLQRKGNRLWAKIRKLNPCKDEDNDFEIGRPKRADETPEAHQAAILDRNAKLREWESQPLTIVLSKKMDALLENTYLKWALKNRNAIWPQVNEHTLAILDSFDVGGDDAPESD